MSEDEPDQRVGDRTVTLTVQEQFALLPAVLEQVARLQDRLGMQTELEALESVRRKLLEIRRGALAEVLALCVSENG